MDDVVCVNGLDGGRVRVLRDARVTVGSPNNRAGAVLPGLRLVEAEVAPAPAAARKGAQPLVYRVLTDRADLYLAQEAFREAFAADVDPETAAVMAAAQRPYAAAAFAAAPSGPVAWKTLPCWYLLGTEDKAIPPALQRFMAERANATIVEVRASHVSFVSQPQAATQLILQAVGATSR